MARKKTKPGPEPKRLKIQGDWKDALRRAVKIGVARGGLAEARAEEEAEEGEGLGLTRKSAFSPDFRVPWISVR